MVRRGPKRSVLCAQSEELHQKRACLESDARYGVGKFKRGGGVRIFGRGVREKGGSDEPPEPPLVTGLPQGVGKTAPYLGQDSPLTVFASDTSMIHNFHIFCGLRCSITYLP